MNEEKKNSLCRVCLNCDVTQIKKGLSLFEKYNDSLICDKISYIANVKIIEGDGLPDRICSECLLDLETAINFKQKCENSNVILQTTALNPESIPVDVCIKEEKLTDCEDFNVEGAEEEFSAPEFSETEVKPETQTNEIVRKSRAIDLKLECHDCGGLFKSKCKLGVHWKKVHQQSQLICLNCKRTFKSFKALHVHLQKMTQSCKSASNFHIEGQGRLRVFHCKECSYKSIRIKDLSTHMVVHSGERPFVCDLCPRGFTQQSSLQAHKEASHKTYLVEATCQYCGKHIKGRNKLYRHLKQHRNNSVQCSVCQKSFKSKNSLNVHMKRHSSIRAYSCEVCGRRFYTSSELYNHKHQVHIKSKRYKCDLCEYVSHRSSNVKKHRSKHTGTNIPCLVCGMFLDNAQQLMFHEKRHFDRKHPCQHCDMKFFSRKTLSSHVRAKHKCTMLVNKATEVNIKIGSVKNESPSGNNQKENDVMILYVK